MDAGRPRELEERAPRTPAHAARGQAPLSVKSALALFLFLAVAAGGALAETPASRVEAQQQQAITQPGNNAPVWREVRSGENHYSSLPGREMGVLIQSSGETWRRVRNGP